MGLTDCFTLLTVTTACVASAGLGIAVYVNQRRPRGPVSQTADPSAARIAKLHEAAAAAHRMLRETCDGPLNSSTRNCVIWRRVQPAVAQLRWEFVAAGLPSALAGFRLQALRACAGVAITYAPPSDGPSALRVTIVERRFEGPGGLGRER